MTSGQHAEQPPAKRRGPKPAISDQALLVAIEADLEASPWEGEGYRKVWARLRVCRDIRVARKRVLRLMRENNGVLDRSTAWGGFLVVFVHCFNPRIWFMLVKVTSEDLGYAESTVRSEEFRSPLGAQTH